MRQQVDIHIIAEQEDLTNYHLSLDAVIREEFDYKGGGVWCSAGTYVAGYDDEVAKDFQKFAEERLKEYGITEFYTEINKIYD